MMVAPSWIPLENWTRVNGFGAPQRIAMAPAPVYTINTTNGLIRLRVGSQSAYCDGVECFLGFAPQFASGHALLNSLDIQKNLEPLLASPPVPKPNPVIVLDPGHGGSDTGARSVLGAQFEKDYTLDLARRLQDLLITNGWTVLLTRSNDVYMALSNRVQFAEQHKADLFVSLHFNSAAPDHTQAGLETYCLTPAGMPSNLKRGYQDDAGLVFPNNHYDTLNLQYAALLHRALLEVNGHLDRGVRHARFLGVLQNQNRPAVLLEGGFLSNPAEARRIADPGQRQRMAEAIAGALVRNPNPTPTLASRTATLGSDTKAN